MLGFVASVTYHLRGGLSRDRPVQLVLHGGEEGLRQLGIGVVVDGGCVDVGDLLVEAALRRADGLDPLEQFVEVVERQVRVLEAFIVEDEALDDELTQALRGPDPERRGRLGADPVPDRDDHVQVVVPQGAADFAATLLANL
jgi:hypothetical protein